MFIHAIQHLFGPVFQVYRERAHTKKGLGRRYSRKLPKLSVPLDEAPGPFPAWILPDSPVDYKDQGRPTTKITIGPRDGKKAIP